MPARHKASRKARRKTSVAHASGPRPLVAQASRLCLHRRDGGATWILGSVLLAGVLWPSTAALAARATARQAPQSQPAAAATSQADDVGRADPLQEFGPQFRDHRSPHFSILTDVPHADVDVMSGVAEETCQAVQSFADRLGIPSLLPTSKMTVVLLDDWEAYAAEAARVGLAIDRTTPGFFEEQSNRCYLFISVMAGRDAHPTGRDARPTAVGEADDDQATSEPSDDPQRAETPAPLRSTPSEIIENRRLINETVIRHEIAHQVLFNIGIQKPDDPRRWLTEGLAMRFESDRPVNRPRLADFLALEARRVQIGVRLLITRPAIMDSGSRLNQAGYATAWALVHSLAAAEPAGFARYLQTEPCRSKCRHCRTSKEIRAFEKAFGSIDGDFDRTWRGRIHDVSPGPAGEAADPEDRENAPMPVP